MEEWKDIQGYPGYEVSTHGRVRSYKKFVSVGKWEIVATPQRLLKPSRNKWNYLGLSLVNNGVVRRHTIAALVLSAFVGPCPENMEKCHADGNPLNNHLSNLRYDTRVANGADRRTHYRKHGSGRFDASEILYIRSSIANRTQTTKELTAEFSVSTYTITKICLGKTYQKFPGQIVDSMPIHHTCKRRKRGKSKYRGVCKKRKGKKKYRAQIWIGGRGGGPVHLGCYATDIEAAKAYDNKAKELHGAFAALNFPDEQNLDNETQIR